MNSQIREAAAEWLVDFRTDAPDAAVRRRFAIWLRTSPEHIEAYLSVLSVWEDAQAYIQQQLPDVNTLVALARTEQSVTDLRIDDNRVESADILVPENREVHASGSRIAFLRRRLGPRTAMAAIAVVLSLVINFAVTWMGVDSKGVTYTTQVAEQRSILLSDGSHVDLNGVSNLRVKFSSHERTTELLAGEAIFRVAKDAKRPFVVRVEGTRLRAVGTEFDVNRTPLGTVLTVVEGRVAVLVPGASAMNRSGPPSLSGGNGSAPTAIGASSPEFSSVIDAGQQAMIVGGTITESQAADTAAATSWTRSLLIFSSTPLAVVAAEFNRFNPRRLAIVSPTLDAFPVTGVFHAAGGESLSDFVVFLRKQPGIEVLEEGNVLIVQTRSAQ